MTQEGEAPEGTEEEEAAEEEAEEAVDENQELVAQVPDPTAMTGTIDTSGAGAPLVAEQMETITPGMMADTGHTEELQEVVDRVEGGEEAQAEEGEEEAPVEEEEEGEGA